MDRNLQSDEVTDELPNVEEETKAASPLTPTSEKQKNFKRKKMIAKRGPKAKKARAEVEKETEEEAKVEAEKHQQEEESAQPNQEGNQEENPLTMVVNTSVDATPLQSQAPTQPRKPKIVNWFVTDEGLKHVYTFVREDKSTF